jgi:integrase/recombinase XerD
MSKLPETLTEPEFEQLIKATLKTHHKAAFALGFYQGMRVSEIVNLKQEHIDEGQHIIRIKQGKGGKDRNIPIAPKMLKGLKHVPIGCGVRSLEIAFKSTLKRAGINKDLHFHSLRHSCATHLLNVQKWNIRQVQQFLGHANLNTTQIYTHVSPQDLVDLMWGGK